MSEHIARLDDDYNYARALHLNACIGRLPCPDCGTVDGMAEWDAPAVWALEMSDNGVVRQGDWIAVGIKFYRHHSRNDVLYATCWQCNGDEFVPDGFVELTPVQVGRWLKAQAEKEGGNNG